MKEAYHSIKHIDVSNGLSQMKVSSILEDSIGNVWVGTRNGLNKINGTGITRYYQEDGLPSNRIHDILCLSRDRITVLTSKGLSFFNGETFSNHPYEFTEVENRLIDQGNGRLLILSFSAITLFDGKTFRKKEIQTDINNYYLDDTGILYVRSLNSVVRLDTALQVVDSTKAQSDFADYRLSNSFYYMECLNNSCTDVSFRSLLNKEDILVIRSARIELSASCRSTYLISKEQVHFLKDAGELVPFASRIVRPTAVFLDREKNLWIGGENGVELFVRSPFERISGSEDQIIWAINETQDSTIVMASFGRGLFEYEQGVLRSLSTSGLYFPVSIKSETGGIYFSNSTTFAHVNAELGISYPYPGPGMALAYDERRKVLIASGFGKVLFHPEVGPPDSLTIADGLHDHYYIQDIVVDGDGNYWFSSYGGLSHYDPDSKKISNYTAALANLPVGPGVFSSYLDDIDNVWLGGESGLMLVVDGTLQQVRCDALQVQIKGITSLNQRELLLATRQELIAFDRQHFLNDGGIKLRYLNAKMGYTGIEPGFTPFYNASDERIYLTSSTSVDVLDPSKVPTHHSRPLARFQSVNGERIPFERSTASIKVKGNSSLVLEGESIGLSGPITLMYNFKLDDKDWTGWQEKNIIDFQGLEHGDHIVQLAVGPYGDLSPQYLDRLTINIHLPFHKRSNFPALVIAALSILALLALLLFIRALIRKRRYVRQLGESRYLRSQLLLSQMSPHFIFNVLSSIQHKILFGSKAEANEKLVDLSNMMRNYLDVSYRSNNPSNVVEYEIPLSKEIELLETYLQFEKGNSNGHFDYQITLDDGLAAELEMLPPMLIQPYVENAVKHGVLPKENSGFIKVTFEARESSLICIVQDNGLGYDTSDVQKNSEKERSSYGMRITDERIELLNQLGYAIAVNVYSQIGEGTQVRLTINTS